MLNASEMPTKNIHKIVAVFLLLFYLFFPGIVISTEEHQSIDSDLKYTQSELVKAPHVEILQQAKTSKMPNPGRFFRLLVDDYTKIYVSVKQPHTKSHIVYCKRKMVRSIFMCMWPPDNNIK